MHSPLARSLVALVLVAGRPFVAAQSSSLSPSEMGKGAQYRVREINWTGIRVFPFEQIKSISSVHVEDVLDMSKVQATVEAVRSLYVANGYSSATIVLQVRVLNGLGVSVSFRIVEGAQLQRLRPPRKQAIADFN